MAFRAAVVLFLMSSMSSKCLPFNTFFTFRNRKKSLGTTSGEYWGCSSTVICLLAKNFLTDSALIQDPTFSRRHTKTYSDNNRRHSETDCHRSTTTQLWNADMPTSSNHTNVSVHCCHSKHTVSYFVCPSNSSRYTWMFCYETMMLKINTLHERNLLIIRWIYVELINKWMSWNSVCQNCPSVCPKHSLLQRYVKLDILHCGNAWDRSYRFNVPWRAHCNLVSHFLLGDLGTWIVNVQ
jgi:hypothetical protein